LEIIATREAHEQDGGRLGFQGQVRNDVLHLDMIEEFLPERRTVARVVDRLRDGEAHHPGRDERTVETGVIDHLDDGRHAASFLPDQPRDGVIEFDLGGGIGAVAKFVF
jgi:hypothetical protein